MSAGRLSTPTCTSHPAPTTTPCCRRGREDTTVTTSTQTTSGLTLHSYHSSRPDPAARAVIRARPLLPRRPRPLSSSSSSTSTPPFPGYKHHVPPSSSSPPPASAASGINRRIGGLSLPAILSYAQLVLHFFVLLLFPFVFLPLLSVEFAHTAYTYSLYLSALAYTLNIVRTHSFPSSPYQQYFLRLLQDQHSHFLFYTFVCLSAPPNAIFLVPFTVRSTLYVAGALSRLLPTYVPPSVSERVVPLLNKVVNQAAELQRTNAILEITAGRVHCRPAVHCVALLLPRLPLFPVTIIHITHATLTCTLVYQSDLYC